MTNLSYQLYSSRNFPPMDHTLSMLAELGYTSVEGYGGLFEDVDAAHQLIKAVSAAGLAMPTSHFSLEMVEGRPEDVVALAKEAGMEAIFVPYLDEGQRPSDANGWRAFGARLDAAGAPLRDAGISFGWHNHDFEFSPGSDAHPLDYIFEGGQNLAFEFDVAWCVRAGENPAPFIDQYGDRMVAAHLKDIAPDGQSLDEDGWADVGFGTMDWGALLKSLKSTACKHFVMEHDNPNDHVRFATRSYSAVSAL